MADPVSQSEEKASPLSSFNSDSPRKPTDGDDHSDGHRDGVQAGARGGLLLVAGPVVAYFSSRGPSAQTGNVIKPDVAAPGVNILASWIPTSSIPEGQAQASQFKLVSGTSMACPHVAGAAAAVKAWNPAWSPAAIRSAIMTTGNN